MLVFANNFGFRIVKFTKHLHGWPSVMTNLEIFLHEDEYILVIFKCVGCCCGSEPNFEVGLAEKLTQIHYRLLDCGIPLCSGTLDYVPFLYHNHYCYLVDSGFRASLDIDMFP